MDLEDQDHFRTIAAASAGPQTVSSSKPSEGHSPSAPDQAFCLKAARTLFACYRKDEAHDPETYCAAVAAVFGDYAEDIIALAIDPRTGIAGKQKFLPAVAEIRSFCEAAAIEKATRARYSSLPKFKPVHHPPPKFEPNLFVPDCVNRYHAMLRLHEETQGKFSYLTTKVCKDGVTRSGIQIPLSWWEAPPKADQTTVKTMEAREDAA